MILIQTMCNKPGGKALWRAASGLKSSQEHWGCSRSWRMLQSQSCCKDSAVAVSDNVHNSAPPWIVPDFIQV